MSVSAAQSGRFCILVCGHMTKVVEDRYVRHIVAISSKGRSLCEDSRDSSQDRSFACVRFTRSIPEHCMPCFCLGMETLDRCLSKC